MGLNMLANTALYLVAFSVTFFKSKNARESERMCSFETDSYQYSTVPGTSKGSVLE